MTAKRKPRRRHEVQLTVTQGLSLAKQSAAVEFRIFSGTQLLGTLGIGRGSFVWWGRKRKKGRRLSWERFAALLEG